MSDQVKQVALEEFEQAKVLARDAVRSAAYLYPLKVSPLPHVILASGQVGGLAGQKSCLRLWQHASCRMAEALPLNMLNGFIQNDRI
jgi:hypothetical protein